MVGDWQGWCRMGWGVRLPGRASEQRVCGLGRRGRAPGRARAGAEDALAGAWGVRATAEGARAGAEAAGAGEDGARRGGVVARRGGGGARWGRARFITGDGDQEFLRP